MKPNSSTPKSSLQAMIDAQKKRHQHDSAVQRFFSQFSTIFVPLIPGFIAAGLLLGLASVLEQSLSSAILPAWASMIGYLKLFSKGLFAFLGILIGYNTQQTFGGSGVNGAIIASLFVMSYDPQAPQMVYAGIEQFLGWQIDPRGGVVGILMACVIGAKVECFIRSKLPASVDMILTSFFLLLIMGVVTFLIIMPVGVWIFQGMYWLFAVLNGNPFGCALLASLFLVAALFGIQQGFIPVYIALLQTEGFNTLYPVLGMAGAGQVGAAIALYCKSQPDSLLRQQIKTAIVPGILGIGEPLMYGVMLPRIWPFITASLGGAIGGFFIGLMAYLGIPIGLNTVFGPSGIVAIPLMVSNMGIWVGMGIYALGLVIATCGGFLVTYFFGGKSVNLS